MKKTFIIVLFVALLLPLSVFAQGAKEAAIDETKPVTIQYWTHEDPARTQLETELIAKFMADNPNITVVRSTQRSSSRSSWFRRLRANQGLTCSTCHENQYAYITNGRVARSIQAAGMPTSRTCWTSTWTACWIPSLLMVRYMVFRWN
jgi:multiple sugar transport system substrate-binding protein